MVDARIPGRALRFNGIILVAPFLLTAMVLIYAVCWVLEVLTRSVRRILRRTLGFFIGLFVVALSTLGDVAIAFLVLACPATLILRLVGHRAAALPVLREGAHTLGNGTMRMRTIPEAAPATCSASSVEADVVVQLYLGAIGLPTSCTSGWASTGFRALPGTGLNAPPPVEPRHAVQTLHNLEGGEAPV